MFQGLSFGQGSRFAGFTHHFCLPTFQASFPSWGCLEGEYREPCFFSPSTANSDHLMCFGTFAFGSISFGFGFFPWKACLHLNRYYFSLFGAGQLQGYLKAGEMDRAMRHAGRRFFRAGGWGLFQRKLQGNNAFWGAATAFCGGSKRRASGINGTLRSERKGEQK